MSLVGSNHIRSLSNQEKVLLNGNLVVNTGHKQSLCGAVSPARHHATPVPLIHHTSPAGLNTSAAINMQSMTLQIPNPPTVTAFSTPAQ